MATFWAHLLSLSKDNEAISIVHEDVKCSQPLFGHSTT